MITLPDKKNNGHSIQANETFIVAIGASAGGLEAIHEFFDHMSNVANVSFVIVQHLSSDYKSLLVELVSRHTRMKVFEASESLVIEKNCIYVIPNNRFLTIKKNSLLLEAKKNPQAPNNAIDTFFYSLAADKKNKAIAIVLSGTGTDGTKGIEAIKKKGGLVIVQDPVTAKFDGMPNSAIQSGMADLILSPSEMPFEIVNYTKESFIQDLEEIKESELEEIFTLIHQTIGFDFHYYKLPTITRRIERRMLQLGLTKVSDYVDLLRNNTTECKQLGNDFLIGVTRFFRDREAFALLAERIEKDILEVKQHHDQLKIWVCACSTGEEAYSIAILLDELLEKTGKNIEPKIFATDVDEMGIQIAAKGVYSESIQRDVDKGRLEKYFVKKASGYQIIPRIRKQIVFAKHDVIRDPPFINNDLISCRNMLIYVSGHLQQKIFGLLLFALNRNGFLFLGSSENSAYIRDNVEEISLKWKIYRKIKDTRISDQYLHRMPDKSLNASTQYRSPAREEPKKKPATLWDAVKAAISEEINLAAFYIDDGFNIQEAIGNYEKFLALPKKKLQLNILGMVPPDLYFLLSSEIKKAWKSDKTAHLKNLRSKKDNHTVSWQVLIKPGQPYTLIVITEQDIPGQQIAANQDSAPTFDDHAKNAHVQALENELEEVKHNLSLAVEDLETTNEELQSTNEELLSANEELQSSNEELQSLNEELHTLNTEHQAKIRELIELNDDLNNYFRSTDIAQIFLDRDLNIRKFNPASADMINFIDSDIGRPLSHISNNIRYDNFYQDVLRVLDSGEVIEREVILLNSKNLLMRIMPYLNREKIPSGIIITFVDITTITQLNDIVRAVLNSSPGVILAFRAVRIGTRIVDFVLETANHAAEEFLHDTVENSIGLSMNEKLKKIASKDLFDRYVSVVESDILLHKDILFEEEDKWYSMMVAKMLDGFVATFSDITSKKRSEQKLKKSYLELISVKDSLKKNNEQLENKVRDRTRALAESEERFRFVARATNDALWDWDLVNNKIWWGDAFYKLFGYEDSGETDRSFWSEKIHPEDSQRVNESLLEAINSKKTQWAVEYRFQRKDGTYSFVLDRGYVLHDEFGTPYRMLGSMFDVTALKLAEQQLSTLNEQLEHKVVERTRELEEINHELELSNNDLQQFASVASHDLQEPLRKIHMFASILKDSIGENNQSTRYIDRIMHSARRMRSLITDILNYSRLSANDSRFEIVDLNELLQGTLDDFELTIKEKNAKIIFSKLPKLEVNAGQIRQVIQNLISNALKFSRPDEPPVITIEWHPIAARSFDAPVDVHGRYYLITISDNGIGFDPEFSGNIFNLFQRLHPKDKFEGTGIGLAVTKKIIEKHNGLIKAESRDGQGSKFSLILPITQSRT